MNLSLLKLMRRHGKIIVQIFYIHCIKLGKKTPLQIYSLNACELDWEKNLLDFCVESIAFRIKIFINVTSI